MRFDLSMRCTEVTYQSCSCFLFEMERHMLRLAFTDSEETDAFASEQVGSYVD